MVLRQPPSSNTPGITVDLGTEDSALVNANVTLVSTGQSCIVGTGSNQTVTVRGNASVTGAQYGILLGGPDQTGETVTIDAGASVAGASGGIRILASDAKVTNAGTVTSTNGAGVFFGGDADTASQLSNTGAITGKANGVLVRTTDDFTLTNATGGTIAGTNAFNSTGGSDDTIVNTGALNGNVRLGSGDDVYRGQTGTVTGTVFGGRGNDTITTGKGSETIDGGSGNDRLRGGLDADNLPGGTGADRFIFASTLDSTGTASDTIKDFSSDDEDKVSLRQIDANTANAGNQAFTFIDEAAFSGKAGELRAETTVAGTLVQGDVNGDRTADFAILFTDVTGLEAQDFVL